MHRHASIAPNDLKIAHWQHSQLCQFFLDFGLTGPRKVSFPIESIHRRYNSVSSTVLLYCDYLGCKSCFAF